MSIKLEIIADNAEDLRAQLRALLGETAAAPVALAASGENNAGKSTPTRTRAAAKPDTAEAGASGATSEASTETGTTSTTATSGASPSEPAVTEKPKTETAAAPADGLLDFDKHVAPKVLGYVKSHSKDFVSGVLEQFGVAKASELSADRWPELLTALDEAASVA